MWEAIFSPILNKLFHLGWQRQKEDRDKELVYNWLQANTNAETGYAFRSTQTIASHCNLTMERTRYICSIHPEIHMSTGKNPDMWSLKEAPAYSIHFID